MDGAFAPRREKFSAFQRVSDPMVFGLMGFLTLVDLFAAQAILPTLAARFAVSPSQIGLAANASTFGMAAAGLLVALFGASMNRRAIVWGSLVILSVPTFLLAFAPNLETFTVLRILQGVFMVAAFSMTMSYLSETYSAEDSAKTLAAYVTGIVASNLFGRLIAGALTDAGGVAVNFYFFAILNIAGAGVAFAVLRRNAPLSNADAAAPALQIVGRHLRNGCLLKSFGIGFLILFAFIGVFTYVNFVLAAPPIALSAQSLGLVYFVFAPAMITTPSAGRLTGRFGARRSFFGSLGLALVSLPLLLSTSLAAILIGLAIVGVGTFFAQATATGFVARAAKTHRVAASGIYLTSYYLGGLSGAAILGPVFERYGWPAAVGCVAVALALAGALAASLRETTAEPAPMTAQA